MTPDPLGPPRGSQFWRWTVFLISIGMLTYGIAAATAWRELSAVRDRWVGCAAIGLVMAVAGATLGRSQREKSTWRLLVRVIVGLVGIAFVVGGTYMVVVLATEHPPDDWSAPWWPYALFGGFAVVGTYLLGVAVVGRDVTVGEVLTALGDGALP